MARVTTIEQLLVDLDPDTVISTDIFEFLKANPYMESELLNEKLVEKRCLRQKALENLVPQCRQVRPLVRPYVVVMTANLIDRSPNWSLQLSPRIISPAPEPKMSIWATMLMSCAVRPRPTLPASSACTPPR